MAGRHATGRHEAATAPPRTKPRLLFGLAALVVVGVLSGGTVWASGDMGDGAGGGMSGGTGAEMAGQAAHSGGSAMTGKPMPSAAVPTALLNCRQQDLAGDKAVKLAEQSYTDWNEHVRAQFELEDGTITLAKANEVWDKGHARGDGDMNAFDAQRIVYERQASLCSKLPVNLPKEFEEPAQACVERAAAIHDTLEAGIKVADDWAKHTLVHRTKEQTDPTVYNHRWVAAAHAAGPHLDTFAKAYHAYQKAPACQLTPSS